MQSLAKSFLRHPVRWIRLIGSERSRVGQADVSRWQKLENFDPAWDERSRQLAARVPKGASVLEFGCGRGALPAALPADAIYLGSDIFARGPETLVWDLNSGAPPLDRDFDVAIFSGVLEYVADVPAVIRALRPQISTILASYASVNEVPDPLTRRVCGWVNHFTEDSFVDLLNAEGYRLVWHNSWTDSTIYQFERHEPR